MLTFEVLFLADTGSAWNSRVCLGYVAVCTWFVVRDVKLSILRSSEREIPELTLCWGEASSSKGTRMGLDFKGHSPRSSEPGVFFAIPCEEGLGQSELSSWSS